MKVRGLNLRMTGTFFGELTVAFSFLSLELYIMGQ